MMRTALPLVALILGAFLCPIALVGCNKDEDEGLSKKQKQAGARLKEIATKSGGEWKNLTPDDRNFLVNDMSHGSEQSAKMLLLGASGKIGAKAGNPQSATGLKGQ